VRFMAAQCSGSRTGATGSWLCIARFTNRSYRIHGGAMPNPVNPVNPVEKRPNAWLCIARFANRSYRIHGGAMPNPVNPVNPVQKTAERMASQCAVHEPELRDRGFALRGSRTGATESWRLTARFANRGYGIMAVQCLILSIRSILSKNVRTHGVAMSGSRTGTTESGRCNA
jgi:hypothetical protein